MASVTDNSGELILAFVAGVCIALWVGHDTGVRLCGIQATGQTFLIGVREMLWSD